jgi:hypothetical protein
MHFILKLHFLKHNHSSKTLECLCPCATLHVSVINLDHPQEYCSCCTATVRLVVVPRHNFIWACGCVTCPDKVVTKTTKRTVALQQEQYS